MMSLGFGRIARNEEGFRSRNVVRVLIKARSMTLIAVYTISIYAEVKD